MKNNAPSLHHTQLPVELWKRVRSCNTIPHACLEAIDPLKICVVLTVFSYSTAAKYEPYLGVRESGNKYHCAPPNRVLFVTV